MSAIPAFVTVPVEGLLDPAYVDQRARLIGDQRGAAAQPGNPAGARVLAADRTLEPTGTSHFIIRDAARQCRVDDHDGRIASSAPGGWSTASSSTTR